MKIYLGAGLDRKEGFTHVDKFPFPGIDKTMDAEVGLLFEDNSADVVFTQDFLEHIKPERKIHVINEIWRVLKPDGVMEHFIPNAGSRNDFGSPSHLSHWNLQQFEHFDLDSYRYEKDHEYEGITAKFKKVLAEEGWSIQEYFGMMPQSIHVIYKAIKP